MNILGKNSVSSIVKIIVNTLYYIFLLLLVIVIVLFTIKIISPNTEIIDFKFQKEIDITTFVPTFPKELNIPALEDARINNIKATTNFNITHRQTLFIAFISMTLIFLYFIIILSQLRKIFKNLTVSNPFCLDNAKSIIIVGYSIVIFDVATFILTYIFELYTMIIKFFAVTITFSYDTSIVNLFIGLILIILGEIFKLGTSLKKEQELTV